MLQLHDARTLVGGNIGGSLLDRLAEITADTLVVLELSSFQLEHLDWLHYSPPLAVVLNLAPNHLDRHGTMAAYQRAKEVILAYQTPGRYRRAQLGRPDGASYGSTGPGAAVLLQHAGGP